MIDGGRTSIIAALVGFLAIVAAYVVLVLNGEDPNALIQAVVVLAGLVGLGAHNDRRIKQQNTKLDTITRQTNGVLDERIKNGATAAIKDALRAVGHNIPE